MYENSPVVQRELYKGACAPQAPFSTAMPKICISVGSLYFCTCSGSTYIKIGTIQRRLAWPLRKDDTQIREAFQIFDVCLVQSSNIVETLFSNKEHTQVGDVYHAPRYLLCLLNVPSHTRPKRRNPKTDKMMMLTLISVTIWSLKFFICAVDIEARWYECTQQNKYCGLNQIMSWSNLTDLDKRIHFPKEIDTRGTMLIFSVSFLF